MFFKFKDNKIENFYLFSSSYDLAKKLYYLGKLKAVYAEKRHFNLDIFNFCSLRDIPIYFLDSIEQLDEYIPLKKEKSVGISYGIGFIFKNKHINAFTHGIWNIHTGKLPQNRGRHPLGWSFINNDKYFTVSIHQINEQIDQGILLHEENIERDINDDSVKINEKVNKLICEKFIDIAINNYQKGKVKKLKQGKYNKNLIGKFDNINSLDYSSKELFSIFKSQSIYGPLKIDGVLYKKCDFYCDEMKNYSGKIILCKDNKRVLLQEI